MHATSRRSALLLALASALPSISPARAAGWPAKPVRIVIAAPPGGVADIIARLLVDDLARRLAAPVIVDYKPGASGVIAVQDLLTAPADGHTFLMIQRGIATEVPLAMKVRFDPATDLRPFVQLARAGLLLVGSSRLPARTLAELVADAKAHPGELHFAAVGFGLRSHTLGLQFAKLAGVDLPFVAYQGAAPALKDLLGGHVPLMIEAPPVLLPAIASGQVRAFAINAPTRSDVLPDVPTFTESGYPQLADTSWFALWARPGVPDAVQDTVRSAVLQFLEQPTTQARLKEFGLDPGLPLTAAELARDVREASALQARILQSIDFKPQ
ncbi:tripartite tricarboxylate transporter substrate binding protein [Ramlibacter ginsenosidimutans]|uniref:Tripartite tricarboxylate transporter substrate binding protein n=1 Tax=Ramlibacter ginsenosidimutans TaxID=502333 RepID=A0A934TXN0_9BURK|nr:tripartite tricarboxylate transporter substrate binding protein [Ramlibacter ginsenosidimutans]